MSPRVSIVVPTRDRLGPLRSCLSTLLAQEPAGLAEILVVDDGSSDGTAGYLAGLTRSGLVVGLAGPGRGPAAARNAGIRRARTPVVAMTDDDCEAPRDWAARLLARLEETGAAVVGGRVVAAAGTPLAGRLSQAITSGFVAALNRDPSDAAFLTSNNVACRTAVLRDAGLFDEAFKGAGGEDRELHHRLRCRGARLVYAPDIVVEHRPRLDWGGFLRQQAAYGRGARLFYGRTQASSGGPGEQGAGRPRRLGLDQYGRAVLGALAELPPRDRPALFVGLPLSQAAVAWGYFRGPW